MAQGKTDNLEAFAKRIATRLKEATGNTDSIEREFCRMFTSNKANDLVKIQLMKMWSEWRYGKAKETHEVTGAAGGPLVHTIRFGDGNSDNAKP